MRVFGVFINARHRTEEKWTKTKKKLHDSKQNQKNIIEKAEKQQKRNNENVVCVRAY